MKTRTLNSISIRARQSLQGLTLLEMLVSSAMLTVIILGLTAMLVQTQNAFKTGVKRTTITDAGRAVVDQIALDMSQMANNQFTNQVSQSVSSFYPPTFFYIPNLTWTPALNMVQYYGTQPVLTNSCEDIYIQIQTNNVWAGVGYAVSNWFPNDGLGVGTLYRYEYFTNGPLFVTNSTGLYTNFTNGTFSGTFANFHRIADGVIGLKIKAYDASGNEMFYGSNLDITLSSNTLGYPTLIPNTAYPSGYQTNYLPHSVDIELSLLEPETVAHTQALFAAGALPAAAAYLATNSYEQMEVFRQHVLIPSAP